MIYLSQKNPLWKDVKLGTCSKDTIGSSNFETMVFFNVFGLSAAYKLKVLYSIICFNAIEVVNTFFSKKFSTNILFYYKSMLVDLFSVIINNLISMLSNTSTLISWMIYALWASNFPLKIWVRGYYFPPTR